MRCKFLTISAPAVLLVSSAAFAYAHSVPSDPVAPRAKSEDYPPSANTPQVTTVIPSAPGQVESVVNRFKLWRTGSTLRACFLNGGSDLRGFFVATARTWLDRGALGVDFGSTPAYRSCIGPTDRAVRIAFGYKQGTAGWDIGNWSYVGTDANTAPAGPTINIGYAANTDLSQLNQRELRRLILHELGHAVALEHEHQSPMARCQFDWIKVIPYYQNHYGWSEQMTRFNLGKLLPIPGLQATAFDPESIMNYGFPPWMFVQTGGQVCEIRENYEPSQADLDSYAAMYPGRPHAVVAEGVERPTSARPSPQEQQDVRTAQEQQEKALAARAVRAIAELEKLLPDEDQRRQAAGLISRIAQQQFSDFTIDLNNNKVTIGNISQKTDGLCSPAIAGVTGSVKIDSKCTSSGNTEIQNSIQGNQINNSGTFNNYGDINSGAQPR